jgi:2-oxoglutarate/2-oxoacid ferredoxin oxidoreductase subunit beta
MANERRSRASEAGDPGAVRASSPPSVPIPHSHLPLSLTPKDFASDQEIRWCPGCGDFSVLAQLKKALAALGQPRENLVFFSGVGCASRTPYYLNTYGFHGAHGRAPALATGLKLVRPDLSVWVITGDGDGLDAGASQLVHALRRNVDVKIILLNNETFGLTRGQYSSTSRPGTRTRSSPYGSVETPLRPLGLALAAEASFVARTVDVDVDHLTATLVRAGQHKGAAFVEVYQNCKVFNDDVFDYATDKVVKADNLVYLEHGQPLIFGQDQNRGIRLRGLAPEVVTLGNGTRSVELLVHDEKCEDPYLAFLLSRMTYPQFPECIGVLRCVQRPTYEELVAAEIEEAVRREGAGGLDELLAGDETWEVRKR